MPIYFVDSSALVKRYRYEAGSDHLSHLLDGADRLLVSRLAHVEVTAAIVRRGRAAQALAAVLNAFDRDIQNSFDVVELNAMVIERAIALTRVHALRAADAIQLACALFARGIEPSKEFVLLASDLELYAAASTEGLAILDPAQP